MAVRLQPDREQAARQPRPALRRGTVRALAPAVESRDRPLVTRRQPDVARIVDDNFIPKKSRNPAGVFAPGVWEAG